MDAVCAEDLFGELSSGERQPPETVLIQAYNHLATIVDPELYKGSPNDKELAQDAREHLDQFYERARARLADGIYGLKPNGNSLRKPGRLAFKTAKREYYIGEPIAEGTIAIIYDGECAIHDEFAGQIAIKIVNDVSDNELAWREARTLKLLHGGNGPQRKHLPVLLDRFQTDDHRVGLIFRHIGESQDLWTIRERPEYREGVDRKHMVWMLNRILSATGYAHNMGIVHGNLEPAHFMVRGRDHNVFIIDWSWAALSPAKTGDQFKIFTEHFSAPEVKMHGPPHPASDLYSIGKCMIHVLGGNVETNEMPDVVEPKLQRFLRYLVMDSMAQRPHDAWDQWRFLDSLVRELWGKKRFLTISTT